MDRRASVSLALGMLLALGGGAAAEPARDKALGFTADGSYFAYLPVPQIEAGGEDGEALVARADQAVVQDLRSGQETTYLLKLELGSAGPLTKEERKKQRELAARYKALPGKAAWTAWQREHPLRCAAGRRSPDGKIGADVKLKGKGLSGSWDKGGYAFGSDSGDAGLTGTLSLLLVLDGRPGISDSWDVDGGAGNLSGDVRTCWSPDSRWLAWLLHKDPPMMRDVAENALRIESLARPRIQLVAHKDIRAAAAAKVAPLLVKAGYAIASSKDASQVEPRPATVVYAAPGQDEAARAVAALVPGGATVARLDWKAAFDLVVAIGQSALAGR